MRHMKDSILPESSNSDQTHGRHAAIETLLPFLKWAGGKRWLVERYPDLFPNQISRYVEPFVGGASVFFALQPRKALLADLNSDLVNAYRQIRLVPEKITNRLRYYQSKHSHEFYYRDRGRQYRDPVKRAAQLLYLNRTCFNGIYRVNLSGEFNVPIGSKTAVVLRTDDFGRISRRLKNVTFKCQDFERTICAANEGDFLFVDPPYTVKHNFNNFIKYNEQLFNWHDQVRLRRCLDDAKARGVRILACNADHPSVWDLYRSGWDLQQVERSSVIAADATKRTITTELIIRS